MDQDQKTEPKLETIKAEPRAAWIAPEMVSMKASATEFNPAGASTDLEGFTS